MTIAELHDGYTSSIDTVTVRYVLLDQADGNTAIANLRAFAPMTYDGLPREDVMVREISRGEGQTGSYYGSARYRRSGSSSSKGPVPGDTGTNQFNFEASLTSIKEYRSLDTPQKAVATGPTFNFERYMNVRLEGKENVPEGVDVRRPISSFSLSFYAANSDVTEAYRNKVEDMVGSMNNAAFQGRAAGEVLFVAASGNLRSDSDWDINLRFEVRKNQASLTVSPGIVLTNVKGWNYVWAYYAPQVDRAAGVTVPKIIQASEERLYPEADLNDLLVAP